MTRAFGFVAAAVALVVLSACGGNGTGRVEGAATGSEAAEPLVAGDVTGDLVAAGRDAGWLVGHSASADEVGVFRVTTEGTQQVATLASYSSGGVAVGDSLVMPMLRCIDDRSKYAGDGCAWLIEARRIDPDGHQESVPITGSRVELGQDGVSTIGVSGSLVTFSTNLDEHGASGPLRLVTVDAERMEVVDRAPESPGVGGYHMIGGIVHDHRFEGGAMSDPAPGVDRKPEDSVEASFDVFRYDGEAWSPVPDGRWTGDIPSGATPRAAGEGYAVGMVDRPHLGQLGFTPSGGWEHRPTYAVPDDVLPGPTGVFSTSSGDAAIWTASGVAVETEPGQWETLGLDQGSRGPLIDISDTTIVVCALRERLVENCEVRPRTG